MRHLLGPTSIGAVNTAEGNERKLISVFQGVNGRLIRNKSTLAVREGKGRSKVGGGGDIESKTVEYKANTLTI